MIVETFVQWAMQADEADRARAAHALGRAVVMTRITPWERTDAIRAVVGLTDDPGMPVRQALACAMADSARAPREAILRLAADEPDVAAVVIMRSPVLGDIDLIDLFARGPLVTRALVAARPGLSDVVAATIAETGCESEITLLLENTGAALTSVALRRIAERMRHDEDIRKLLAARSDLDTETRAGLMIGDGWIGQDEIDIDRERTASGETWSIFAPQPAALAQETGLNAHLAQAILGNRAVAPALLLRAICDARIEEATAAIAALSGMGEAGVAAILARGHFPTLRALFESSGFGRATGALLAQAILLWREAADVPEGDAMADIAGALRAALAQKGTSVDMLDQFLSLAETWPAPAAAVEDERRAA